MASTRGQGSQQEARAIQRIATWSKQQVQPNGARNRALLIGTGWTLAVLVALACFKFSPFETIYLWSLSVVAFGWAGVLLHALGSERRAASASVAAADRETRAVIDGLTQAMAVRMQWAYSEVVRVDELLAHAIEQLMTAFNSVSEQARQHQSELVLAAARAQGTPEAERLRAAAERVASDVNSAITALQFRDVVGQKLGHVGSELRALEQAMHRIREVSAQCAQADLAARIGGLLLPLQQTGATSPAPQELMHAGEVELF
jgi:hypothetical protein